MLSSFGPFCLLKFSVSLLLCFTHGVFDSFTAGVLIHPSLWQPDSWFPHLLERFWLLATFIDGSCSVWLKQLAGAAGAQGCLTDGCLPQQD